MTWQPSNELRFIKREYSPPTSVSGCPQSKDVCRVLQQKWYFNCDPFTSEWRDVLVQVGE